MGIRLPKTLSRGLPPKQLARIRVLSRENTGYAGGEKTPVGIGRIGLGALAMAPPRHRPFERDRIALGPKNLAGNKIDGPNHFLFLTLSGVNHDLPIGNTAVLQPEPTWTLHLGFSSTGHWAGRSNPSPARFARGQANPAKRNHRPEENSAGIPPTKDKGKGRHSFFKL